MDVGWEEEDSGVAYLLSKTRKINQRSEQANKMEIQ